MEKLTDEEILGLIALLNWKVDYDCDGTGIRPEQVELKHTVNPASDKNTSAPVLPLLRKLLQEGVKRGAIRVPACFKGEF